MCQALFKAQGDGYIIGPNCPPPPVPRKKPSALMELTFLCSRNPVSYLGSRSDSNFEKMLRLRS